MIQLETLIARISQFELFELILLLKLDKQFSIKQFEPTVSQLAVSSPPLIESLWSRLWHLWLWHLLNVWRHQLDAALVHGAGHFLSSEWRCWCLSLGSWCQLTSYCFRLSPTLYKKKTHARVFPPPTRRYRMRPQSCVGTRVASRGLRADICI